MNAAEHVEYIKARMADAPLDSLRRAMYVREGVEETDWQIGRGLSAWAIERRDPTHDGGLSKPQTTIVFGTCRSDALRRAKAPARLGESFQGTVWDALQLRGEWDGPIIWPFPPAVAKCPQCVGGGRVWEQFGSEMGWTTCRNCKGAGRLAAAA